MLVYKEGLMIMKRFFSKILISVALLGLISSSVMAAEPIEVYNDNSIITVKVSGLNSKEETSLLVTKDNASISQAFADTTKIYHIDQVAADEQGVSTFNFTYSGEESLTIYSGYATMPGTKEPYRAVLDESTPPVSGEEYMLGDVNGDGVINVTDVASTIQHVVSDTPFKKDVNGVMVDYQQGAQAADVNKSGDINVTDVTKIINYIVNDTPFDE